MDCKFGTPSYNFCLPHCTRPLKSHETKDILTFLLLNYRSWKSIIALGIAGLIFIFVVVPSIFRYSTTLQRQLVFLPWGECSVIQFWIFLTIRFECIRLVFSVHWPKHIDFSRPDTEGLEGAINYYIKTDPKIEVGVWHIVPEELVKESANKSKAWFDDSLGRGQPIVFYAHGNTGSRAREHRIELYKVLQKLNYHIVCFDYRGKIV